MNEHDIIKTASLTEKSTLMSEKQNKYVFRVSPKANKIQIKNAIERLFQKTVVNVNTCNYAGKEKRLRGPLGRRPRWKKAIVTLKEGEKIDERFRLQLRHNKFFDGQNVSGVNPFAQRFSKSESANGPSNFLRIIARLRAKNDATTPPNRGRFVTGPGATSPFLAPRFCAGQIYFGLGLCICRPGTSRRAHCSH